MSESNGGHLSEDEIQAWLDGGAGEAPTGRGEHMAACDQCRELMEMRRQQDERLRALARHVNSPRRSPFCPAGEPWPRLAAGLTPQPEAEALIAHAAECSFCGPALQHASAAFSEEPDEEVERTMASLASSTPEWKGRMARRAAAEGRRRIPRTWFQWSAAVAAALSIFAWWIAQPRDASYAAGLLARSYSEFRPFAVRVPGAPHGPIRQELGDTPFAQKPAPLLEAEARIQKELERHPDNPEWLDLRARAEMLERQTDAAVQTLRRALELTPGDPILLADLGSAYALRAESSRRPEDNSAAIEALGRSLQKRPQAPDVIFNLALVYERLKLYPDAIRAWERYLSVDSSGAWAQEVRGRLADLKKKLAASSSARSLLADSPDRFLAAVASGAEAYPELLAEETAFSSWPGKPRELEALQALGELLASKHGDQWLRECLRSPQGLQPLSASLRANLFGDHARALLLADQAAQIFETGRNEAGVARAQAERAYAFQRLGKGPQCLDSARTALERIAHRPYPWIQAHLELQLATCANLEARVGAALALAERALTHVRAAGYRSLELRAAAFVAAYRAHLGDRRALWTETLRGLDLWGDGPFRGIRGQNLFLNLEGAAAESEQLFAALVFQRAAVAALERDRNPYLLALSRSALASDALKAGEPEEALREFTAAEALFAALERSDQVDRYRAEASVAHAGAVAAGSTPLPALQLLADLRRTFPRMPTPLVEISFRQTLGGAYGRLGRWTEAGREFAGAVDESRLRLAGLKSPAQRRALLAAASTGWRGLTAAHLAASDWGTAWRTWTEWDAAALPDTAVPSSGETFVSYALLPSGLAVWIVRDGQIHGRWLEPATPQRMQLVRSFMRHCADPRSPAAAWKPLAVELYGWLIAPIEPWMPAGGAVIVHLDGILGSIPLAALMDRQDRFLGERFALVFASFAEYRHRAQRGPASLSLAAPAVVFEDPELHGQLLRLYPPLEDGHSQGDRVSSVFHNTRVFRRETATLDVLESVAPEAVLFHFAGHGVSNAGTGGLLLASANEAELLDTARVGLQDWSRCELAVLAACSSAGNPEETAFSPDTLVRAFLNSGARRVIASLWRVDAVATGDLMRDFYRALARNEPPAFALREASAAVRARAGHPYYWAAFQLFGFH